MINNKENKKQVLEELYAINNSLDTYRTNLNILIYNLFTNDKIKNLPDFDYQQIKTTLTNLGNMLSGINNAYQIIKENEKKGVH